MIKETFFHDRLIVKFGDITKEDTDAIVNAANSTLLGGGGVDGAIHRAGGAEILKACKEIRQSRYPDGLPTGKAVATTAGNLTAKMVIHTVGPVYGMNGGRDAELLADCYTNSLLEAVSQNLESISFPSISTGAFYYPKHEAAQVASKAIREFILENDSIKEIRLVFFSPYDAEIFIRHQSF